jgi:5-(carboxyamino)imidazole ribonucleotide synthase
MPDVKLHLYGKAAPRQGRKMGHITVLGGTREQARARAVEARAALLTRSQNG